MPAPTQRQREIADHLARRRHLHQPAQDPIGGRVVGLDLLEAITQPERDGLLTQVRQLTAGDLVAIHPPRRGRRTGRRNIERRVHLSQRLPVRLQIAHRRQRQPGVVLGVRRRGDDRAQRGLARGARQRRRGTVDGIGAGLPGRQIGGQLPARGVVGVHVHRQVEPAAQRADQHGGGLRAQQSRHVLDRQHVRTGIDDLLGQLEVVVQRVEVFAAGRTGRRCSSSRLRPPPCRFRAPRRSPAASSRRCSARRRCGRCRYRSRSPLGRTRA